MWPALHVVPCVLSIRLCSGAAALIALSVTNASWFAPYVAPFHSMCEVPLFGASAFALIVNAVVWSTHEPPTAPFARLKLSASAVGGGAAAGGATEIATLAVSVLPRPSFTVRIAP